MSKKSQIELLNTHAHANVDEDSKIMADYYASYLICVRCFVDIRRTKYSSKGKISFAITKSVKHGSISLALSSKLFTVDLTVCMDISPNPGPASRNTSVTELSHHCLHTPSSSVVAPSKIKYSQCFLKSLRYSSQTRYINSHVYFMIRLIGILKPFRGRRGGKSLRFREYLNEYLSNPQRQQTTTSSTNQHIQTTKEFVPSLVLTNTMSLVPKIDEVRHFVLDKDPDLVFITETWLKDQIDSNQVDIPEYNMAYKNRYTSSHGGVCLYIKNSIQFNVLAEVQSPEFEVLWVKIRPNRLPRGIPCIITATIYHPPTSNDKLLLDYLTVSLVKLESQYPGCGIILGGDFNHLNINRILYQFKMKQLVKINTRGNNILDLIITNIPQYYEKDNLQSFPPFGLSDHNVLLLTPKDRPTSANRRKTILKRNLSVARKNELGRYLSSINWDIIDSGKTCEEKLSFLEDIIKIGLDFIMPIDKVKVHPKNAPWVTPNFVYLIKCRQKAFTDQDNTSFRHYRNLVNQERKKLRGNYFSCKVENLKNAKPSAWWKELKQLSGMQTPTQSENLISQLHIDNIDKENLLDIANRINSAFVEPMQEYQPLQDNPFTDTIIGPDYEFTNITEFSTYNILKKLNARKATGPDGISNWILKDYAEILAKPVCSVLSSSYKEQRLPSSWKYADVTPLPKQKPIMDINKHLRPISLTSCISKVGEEFIVSNYIAPAILKIIDPNQYGAIPKSSTTQALISMIHQWSKATDSSGAAVRVILYDYRKAFDLIDHNILIKKINDLPIPRKVACWVVDFLMNRFQRVKLSNVYSDWERVPSGVPQGTKLGPWIFLLMINDLRLDGIDTWKYVDDTSTSETIQKGTDSNIQLSSSELQEWSLQNRFQLNSSKCKELRIDFKREKQQFNPVMVNDQPVEVVKHAKLLGLTISSSLKWNMHIEDTIKKANKRLYCLVQLKRAKVPEKEIVQFYCTCIRPVLEYAAPVFHHSLPQYLADDLERVQQRSLGIIFKCEKYNKCLEYSGLETLVNRRQMLCLKLFDSITSNSDHKLYKLLPPKKKQTYNLRHKRSFSSLLARTKRFKNTFIPHMLNSK